MTKRSVKIRAAVPGDEGTLARLNSSVQELHLAKEPHYFSAPDLDELRSSAAALLTRATARVWIAEVDGEAIGYAAAEFRTRESTAITRARRFIEIDQVGVLPSHQRRGVATALIEKVFEAAQVEGIDRCELGVWAFNSDAREAFERLGFHPTFIRYTCEVAARGRSPAANRA